MKILLTGASGFLGNSILSNLSLYEFIKLGRGLTMDISCDLSTQIPLLPQVDLVIHAAGKAHIAPKTEKEKRDFFNVNVIGAKNLLKGLEAMPVMPKYLVFISSVAVYGLVTGIDITEEVPLNALDPYGQSKVEAELLIQEWCSKHNVICSILRLPLLVGPKPTGNLAAMIKGIKGSYYFNIDGGRAKKSMVLAEDVAKVIPKVAPIGGIYNLTDGYHPTFIELSNALAKKLGKKKPMNMPLTIAKFLAKVGDFMGKHAVINSQKLYKIISSLTFDDTKARTILGWNPKYVSDNLSAD